jgi:SH3-like domain-containing protein
MKGWSMVSAGVGLAMLATVPAMAQTPPIPPVPPAQTLPQPTAAPPPRAKSALGQAAPVVSKPRAGHAQKPAQASTAAGKAAPLPTTPPAPPKAAEGAKGAEIGQPATAVPTPKPAVDPTKGVVTGMPLPRWASLRSDEVNLRSGPGTRYPIEWVYHRRDLPVQIEREFEVWRLIEDQDGVKGWVHQATLTGRRSFVVKGGERTLHRAAAADAAPVARLQPGVLGHIRSCDAKGAWCEVQVGEYRGYLKRDDLYGIYPDEAVN